MNVLGIRFIILITYLNHRGIHFHPVLEHALSWHGLPGLTYELIQNYDSIIQWGWKEGKKEQ